MSDYGRAEVPGDVQVRKARHGWRWQLTLREGQFPPPNATGSAMTRTGALYAARREWRRFRRAEDAKARGEVVNVAEDPA